MGNLFVHAELTAADVAAAKKFYGSLFDWKLQDLGSEMGNYTMIDVGSRSQGGGIQGIQMPGQPTGWLSYVEVKSVKDTLTKAEKGGARVVMGYQPIGTMGAIGIFQDPQGALLGLWERTAQPKKKAAKRKATKKAAPKKKAAKKR